MKLQVLNSKNFERKPVSGSRKVNLFAKHHDRLSDNIKEEDKNFENGAFYFLTFIIIVIVTLTLFQSKILNFLFSHFLF